VFTVEVPHDEEEEENPMNEFQMNSAINMKKI